MGYFVCNDLSAQLKSIGLPEIQNFTKLNYKGSTQNWDIAQRKNGYVYFANNKGLLEFDGVSWSRFTIPNSESIRAVAIDNADRIFVGGFKEFGYFEHNESNGLVYHSLSNKIKNNANKEKDFIWKIHNLEDEIVFQSFSKLYFFNNNKIKIINAPHKFQFSFKVAKKLYIQDDIYGILEYKNGVLVKIPYTTIFNTSEVWGIIQIENLGLMFATIDNGLWIFDGKSLKKWEVEASNFVKKNSCLGATILEKKYIVLNTVLDGFVITDFSGKILKHINRKKNLQNNTVLKSFVDTSNNLWLGLDNGISLVNLNSPISIFGMDFNLTSVYALVVHEKKLYVATNQGLFCKSLGFLNDETGFSLVAGTTGQAWNIQVIENQLICAHNRGAFVIEANKVVANLSNSGYWGFKMMPNNPQKLVAANYNGFAIFEKKQHNWCFKNQITGFESANNKFFVTENAIWILKDNKIIKNQLNDNLTQIESIKVFEKFDEKISRFTSLQLLNNKLYAQFENIFFVYEPRKNNFMKDDNLTKLFSKTPKIASCTQDNLGNIWYVFDETIGVFKKNEQGSFNNFSDCFYKLRDDLVPNYESIYAVDNNEVFIGLADGVAHFNFDLLEGNSKPSIVDIKNVVTGKNTFFTHNKTRINIAYRDNSVRFNFAAPNYENISNIEFSYLLDGFDKTWSKWTKVPFKDYTNLKEGSYKMKVKTRNGISTASNIAIVDLNVQPPWYRHPIASVAYLLLICVIVYVIRLRIHSKIRQNKYLETIEQRRIYSEKEFKIRQEQLELEKEIERLNKEQLQNQILLKDKELVNNTLQTVKKNKILNGILTGLKELDSEKMDDYAKQKLTKINKSIAKEVDHDKSWQNLVNHIKNVHQDFLQRLKQKHPEVSPRDLDLAPLLLLNMSTKEISEALNISAAGVELARYRLRKKLNLVNKENLTGYLLTI